MQCPLLALLSPRRLGECQVQPDVDPGMPEQVTRALVLEKSLAVLPTYALAHVNAAMCHHCLFLRAGLKEESPRLPFVAPGTKPLQISEQPTLERKPIPMQSKTGGQSSWIGASGSLRKGSLLVDRSLVGEACTSCSTSSLILPRSRMPSWPRSGLNGPTVACRFYRSSPAR